MTITKHPETESAIRRDRSEDRTAGSFLVRVWYEAREGVEGQPSFRGYIRNLQTGEERFVRDPETVSAQIVRQVAGGTASGGMGRIEQRRAAR